jgi:predicted transposase/invertase (TIGR01784 family)
LNTDVELLSPKLDFVFKSLFCDDEAEGALLTFLNVLFEAKRQPLLESLVIKNPAIDRRMLKDKSIVLDILAVSSTGEAMDVEMMSSRQSSTADRSLFYWSKLFAGQLRKGEAYTKLKRATVLFLLDYTLDHNNSPHSVYLPLEMERNRLLSDKMAIHLIELPKLSLPNDERSLTRSEKWLLFFKGVPTSVWPMLAQDEPHLRKVMMILERLSRNEEMREFSRVRERGLRDYQQGLEDWRDAGRREGMEIGREEGIKAGREEGLAIGRQEGIEVGRQEGIEFGRQEGIEVGRQEGIEVGRFSVLENIVKQMVANEFSAQQIAIVTGLTIEEIESITVNE